MSLKSYLYRSLRYIIKGVPVNNITAQIVMLNSNESLKGKKIVVTGGGRGLGFAMAKKFISEGAEVLIAGRNESTLKASAEKIGLKYLVLDVQKSETFHSFLAKASYMFGGLNVLVNNAGISLHENGFLEVTPESYDAQFNTNLKGPFILTQEFMRLCEQNNTQGIKKVLFISSETGDTMDERPYGLTKAAMNSLVQGLAHKYVKQEYRINAVAPGVTTSDMTGGKADGNLDNSGNITGRYYLPEEVAEVASFLLSDASNVLNGQILVCNEGKTINARWK